MSAFVYIAGPYAAPTAEERAENVRRVGVLSRHAVALGLVPVSVHAAVEAGHFGRDDVPEEREVGLQAACRLAAWVGESGGHFWFIRKDDGYKSDGTRREFNAYLYTALPGKFLVGGTWKELEERMANPDPKWRMG